MEGFSGLKYLLKQTFDGRTVGRLPSRKHKDFFFALDEIDFDCYAGEVVGIIGRNGAGKSTLLKILARVLHPSAGCIQIRGRVVSMLELGIGFAPELSVRENIQIHGRLAGIPSRNIKNAEEGILEFSGLSSYRDLPLSACPSGSAVQLGFAAMINFGADIILADEVLAVGHSDFRKACEDRVKAVGQSGESVLFVSHDMRAIRRVCTRVIWIDSGKIVKSGPTEEVVQAYTDELLSGKMLPDLLQEGLGGGCRLLDFRLLDPNYSPVGALEITEGGFIDCVIQVVRPDAVVTVQIELWQGKNHLMASSSPRGITAREKKVFRVGMRLPPNFLNELQYQARCRVSVSSILNSEEPAVIAAEEKLDFSVMNPHPNDSVWAHWGWGRRGLISPGLTWEVDHDSRKQVLPQRSLTHKH